MAATAAQDLTCSALGYFMKDIVHIALAQPAARSLDSRPDLHIFPPEVLICKGAVFAETQHFIGLWIHDVPLQRILVSRRPAASSQFYRSHMPDMIRGTSLMCCRDRMVCCPVQLMGVYATWIYKVICLPLLRY